MTNNLFEEGYCDVLRERATLGMNKWAQAIVEIRNISTPNGINKC